jgi:SNF2 family DNA or RNA helicase
LDPRLVEVWKRANADLEPSAKMVALLGLLKSWEATGDKTICFSQCRSVSPSGCEPADVFDAGTSVLDLVETLFARKGIQNLRYDGRMDKGSREIALATFKKPGGPKILLLRYAWLATGCSQRTYAPTSTKCGSVGLNLTSANRCIK